MSVFRIQRKKFQIDPRKKVHSEQSKPSFQISKNLAQILTKAEQKIKINESFKRRIITNPSKDQSLDMSLIKRISETYKVTKSKIQQRKTTKFSKKSLSGTKIDAILDTSKNSGDFQKKVKSPNKASSKIVKKFSQEFKKRSKSKGKISNRVAQQISSSKFYFSQSLSKRETKTNRIVSQELSQRVRDMFSQVSQMLIKGLHYYKKKNIVQALDLFLQCVKLDSSNMDCLYHIGSCYLNLRESKQSAFHLQRLRKINPKYNTNLYLYLAINYKNLSSQHQSIKVLEEGIRLFPQFQEGLFYLGKYQFSKVKCYSLIVKMHFFELKKSIRQFLLNQAKLILADAFSEINQLQKAIEFYKNIIIQGPNENLDQKTSLSTHLKLIKLLISVENYDDPSLNSSLHYIESQVPTSPELSYFKSLVLYQTNLQMTPSQIQSIKFDLSYCLNNNQNQFLKIDCFIFLLRILIDTKDLYKAEDSLNLLSKTKQNFKFLTQWKLFVEAANDIIKRKMEEGKSKLQNSLQKLTQKYTIQQTKVKKPLHHISSIKFKDYLYLKHQILEYLSYVWFQQENYNETLNIYDQILNIRSFVKNYESLTNYEKLSIIRYQKRYANKFKQTEINKVLVFSMKEHLQDQNFLQTKQGFQYALQKTETPQRIFMWIINEVAMLRNQQTFLKYQKDEIERLNDGWSDVIDKLKRAEQLSPNFALINFYFSLVLLYLGDSKEALNKVQKAIEKIDQPISQFHYIEGLCYFLISQQEKNIELAQQGLGAISRAIEIDNGIPQFFKERSKHYFCLGMYKEAIKDCLKCRLQCNDSQAKLLSMFYHYLSGSYLQSQDLMSELLYNNEKKQVKQTQRSSKTGKKSQTQNEQQEIEKDNFLQNLEEQFNHRYKQFEQALMFRVKKYTKTGIISQLLVSLTNQKNIAKKLDTSYLKQMQDIIQSRDAYSQFTVYFITLLMAAYFFYQNDYARTLNFLFSCMEEIEISNDYETDKKVQQNQEKCLKRKQIKENQSFQENALETQNQNVLKISEVKYNMIIASLLKNYEQKYSNHQCSEENEFSQQSANSIEVLYHETLNLIDGFIAQSDSNEFMEHFQTIRNLILFSQKQHKQNIENIQSPENQNQFYKQRISVYIRPYFNREKFSDQFPDINVPIGKKYLLVTKFIVFYPPKLRFNIKPQFDPAFLFNFGLDKIDNKITPPWFKFVSLPSCKHINTMIFTDQLRNQSLAFTSTEKQPSVFEKQKIKQKYRYINESINKIPISKSHNEPEKESIRKIMKLDSKIEKKLQRLFVK